MTYDSFGRRLFMNDPDRGQTSYQYDDVGNLIQTTDAKGQVIHYGYDAAERLKTENSIDTTGDPNTEPVDVTYYYDTAVNVDLGDGTAERRNAPVLMMARNFPPDITTEPSDLTVVAGNPARVVKTLSDN